MVYDTHRLCVSISSTDGLLLQPRNNTTASRRCRHNKEQVREGGREGGRVCGHNTCKIYTCKSPIFHTTVTVLPLSPPPLPPALSSLSLLSHLSSGSFHLQNFVHLSRCSACQMLSTSLPSGYLMWRIKEESLLVRGRGEGRGKGGEGEERRGGRDGGKRGGRRGKRGRRERGRGEEGKRDR